MIAAVGQGFADATQARGPPRCLAVRADLLRNAEKGRNNLALVNIHDAAAAFPDCFRKWRRDVIALAKSLQIVFDILIVPAVRYSRTQGGEMRARDGRGAVRPAVCSAALSLITNDVLPPHGEALYKRAARVTRGVGFGGDDARCIR